MPEKNNDLTQNMENPIYQATYSLNPVPASRPRVTRWGVHYGKKYTKFKKDMEDRLLHIRLDPLYEPTQEPLKAFITFNVQIPKSRKKESLKEEFCTNNADIDNYIKAILDAHNKIVYADDKQVVSIAAVKQWADIGSIEVEFYEMLRNT